MAIERVCVYASSSERVAPEFHDVAAELGAMLGERGVTLVYGGADIGLMGSVARGAKKAGGAVVGVIPRHIADHGLAYDGADELIVTETLRERKQEMELRADAFVALPGGFGTLEELLEVITLKQLQRHDKAVCLLNTRDFFSPLVAMFEHLYREGFARPEYRRLYELCDDVEALVTYLDAYEAPALGDKWS